MSQFTQLNLGGSTGNKPAQTPAKPVSPIGKVTASGTSKKKHSSTLTVTAIGGSLAAEAFVAALMLGTNGCSKSNKQAIAAPIAPPPTTAQAPPVALLPAPSASTSKPAKKSSREHILFAYKNPDYGISFLYPKGYRIRKGDKANLEWAGLGPVEMNFVEPGGETLAAVRLPDHTFPGTDFVSGFFKVSVNPKIAPEQCSAFATENDGQATAAGGPGTPNDDPAAPAPSELKKAKFGATEFSQAKSSAGDASKHANAKYYHVYENGACYEFALGIETAEGNAGDTMKPLDTNTSFRKLNWMLSTVKFTPTEMKDEVSASDVTSTESAALKTAPADIPKSKVDPMTGR